MNFRLAASGLVVMSLGIVACVSKNVAPQKPVAKVEAKPVESAASVESPAPTHVDDPDAVYQMRQMHLTEWIQKAQRDCERTKSTDAWLPEREGFPPEEIELVKTRCAESVEVGMRGGAWHKAMSACFDRFVRANGKGKHECRLSPRDVPDIPPEWFDRHKAACAQACGQAGVEHMELDKERSQFVRCCDGTTSPSCTYKTLRQGCCSGHQGVCIPD